MTYLSRLDSESWFLVPGFRVLGLSWRIPPEKALKVKFEILLELKKGISKKIVADYFRNTKKHSYHMENEWREDHANLLRWPGCKAN